MSEITEIKDAVDAWNQNRSNANKAKALLGKGSIFNITRNDFKKWSEIKNKPNWIYAYGGDFKGIFKFILIDSESAQKPLDESTLPYTFVKEFNRNYNVDGLDFLANPKSGNIEVSDALKRVMRWDIMMDSWIEEQTSTNNTKTGVPKAYKIPFESIKDCFINSNVDEVIVVLALKPNDDPSIPETNYLADLTLWSTSKSKDSGDLKVQNIVAPCPPYCDLPTWP